MDYQLEQDKVKKECYRHQVFCWIQKGQTDKVILFYETYPQFVNKMLSPNNWSPMMFAVRYGNMQLVNYFISKGHNLYVPNINSNTLVHAACYANDPKMLTFLLDELKQDPNPPNGDPSPLRYCIKLSNARLLQILIYYGAYYIFDDVFNNIEKKSDEPPVYVSLITGKEVPSNMIVKDTELREYPIKEVLRWARVRNLLYMRRLSEMNPNAEEYPKMAPLKKILQNGRHMDEILKLCVGAGKSLLNTSAQEKDKDAMNIEKC